MSFGNGISTKKTPFVNLAEWYYDRVKYPVAHPCKDTEFVYVFGNPISGLYKIGTTKNIRHRINQITTTSGMIIH